MNISGVIDKYIINHKLKNSSKYTVAGYKNILASFGGYFCDADIETLTIDDINKYHLHLRDGAINSVSLKSYLVHIRAFLNFAYKGGYITQDLGVLMVMPKIQKKHLNILTDTEIILLLDSFDVQTFLGARNKAAVLLMLDCGLRKGEVENLKTDCINFDKRFLIAFGKGSKERIVPFGECVCDCLLHYYALRSSVRSYSEYFFVKIDGEQFSYETIKNVFRDLKEQTKIKRLRPHLLRHTFATNFLINGIGDIYELSRILGHSELQTTQIYLNIANNYIMMEKKKKFSYIDTLDRF